MAKIAKNTFPENHTANDFKAFGPVVTKDCEWGNCRMADLGHFSQEEVDSNKMYHIAVVQSAKTSIWYAYFEWGRTRPDGRPDKPSFQFTQCSSEAEAAEVCRKQFDEKNTKRGKWEKLGSKERFVSKPGKDAYVVRPTATRMVGLPCAENIANENAKGDNVAPTTTPEKKTIKKSARKIDAPTKKLFKDLLGGAVKYANSVMSGGKGKATLPTQQAIEDARDILDDSMVRIKKVGNDIKNQLADSQLKQLTYALYGLVPKTKPIGADESDWLLTQDNITSWRLDLDALETALQANEIHVEEEETDVMQGIPAEVHYIPESDSIYKWLAPWWINATRNRHGHVGTLKIHNLWAVERTGDKKIVRSAQEATLGEMQKWNNERPLHQQADRIDLNAAERKLFWNSNTALMFHGTRSVNVPGIVRENLRFPNQLTGVIITGAMFGPGSYFADDWKKSAGYCSSPNPGRSAYYGGGGEVSGRHAFMFGFDVICGHPHVAKDAYGYTKPPSGHHCVYGKAGHTSSWGRSGGLMNNEWIVYQKGRIEMRYLAEISF